MNHPQQQESWRESLHDMLIALIYRVGEEVTKDYKQKNGVWEGLSVSNEITRQKYQEKLEMLISTERQRVIEQVEGMRRTEQESSDSEDVWGYYNQALDDVVTELKKDL